MDLGYFVRHKSAQRRNTQALAKSPLFLSHVTPHVLHYYWNECRRPLPEDTKERAHMGLMLSATASIFFKTYETVPRIICEPQRPSKRHAELVYQACGTELELDTPKVAKRQRGRPRKYAEVSVAPVTR